jgi:hypothetical protein
MANKNYGSCTPITAKIQKTTKGGITEPLLNVGGPVKMKMTSPAKNKSNRQKANESRQKSKAASDLQKAEAIKANKLKKANELSSKEFIKNKRGRKVKNPDYKTAGTTAGSTDPNYGVSPSSNKPTSQPVPDLLKGPEKRKFTKTITPKKKKAVTIETKRPSADIKIKATITPKVSEKKEKQIKRISDRAAKTRKKGIDALESGNLQRAKRLKGREQRLEKRASRKAKRAIRKSNR